MGSGGAATTLSFREHVLLRILALLHDPPDKQAQLRGHEERAKELRNSVLCVLQNCSGGDSLLLRAESDDISSMVYHSDTQASSYDRVLTRATSRLWRERLVVPQSGIFANIFDTHITKDYTLNIKCYNCKFIETKEYKNLYKRLVDSLYKLIIQEDVTTSPRLLAAYHVFSAVYEPLWGEVLRESGLEAAPMPADTRVPHHTVFDHLHAAAGVSGVIANPSGGMSGVLLYVELPGLEEWLRGAQKLSDLWVAAWLASAMLWYAVREIVRAFGPDSLLYPSQRWNPFYYSLLASMLPGNSVLQGKLKEWYYWEGFPYYAWYPTWTLLLLPAPENVSLEEARGSVDKELARIYEETRGKAGQHEPNREFMRRIIEYVKRRYLRAWRSVVEALLGRIRDAGDEHTRRIRELLDQVKDKPPLEIIVVASGFYWASRPDAETVVEKTVVSYGTLGGSGDFRDKNIEKFINNKLNIIRNKISDSNLNKLFRSKAMYAYQFPLILAAREKALQELAPVRAGWPLHGEPLPCPGEEWRSCTVCRVGPGLFRVPGRELEGGEYDDEFKDFALRVAAALGLPSGDRERAARLVRPVFRPGERLCPYCLVKRLSGLPGVFRAVAERLVGYAPPREVRFPSTDDVAALGAKLALLAAAARGPRELEEEWNNLVGRIVGCAKIVSRHGAIHNLIGRLVEAESSGGSWTAESARNVGEALRAVVERIHWEPPLLGEAVRLAVEAALESSDSEVLRRVAAAVIVAGTEFWDLFDPEKCKDALDALRGLGRALSAREGWRVVGEALQRPRTYLGVLAVRVGDLRRLFAGVLLRPDKSPWDPGEYYWETLQRALEACSRHGLGCNYGKCACIQCSKKILDCIEKEYVDGDPVIALVRELGIGSLLASPSYHFAIAHAISSMNGRLVELIRSVGGIPVHVGGDTLIALVPAWIPVEALERLGLHTGEGAQDLSAGYAALRAPGLVWGESGGFHRDKALSGRLVPGLADSSVGVGLRFAHYRDSLGMELSLALTLASRAQDKGRWGAVAVSMGRAGPAWIGVAVQESPVIALERDPVVRGCEPEGLKLAVRLAGLVMERALSTSGLRRLLDTIGYLASHGGGEGDLRVVAERMIVAEAVRHARQGMQKEVESVAAELARLGPEEALTIVGAAEALYKAATRGTGA